MSYIGILDFFGDQFELATDDGKEAARALLDKVNALLLDAEANGVDLTINPRTKTYVCGKDMGGHSVDIYDPREDLDRWLTDARLEAHGLYRDAPGGTKGWCRLTDQGRGLWEKRTFQP